MTTELPYPYLIPTLLSTLSMLVFETLSSKTHNVSRAMETLTEPAERENLTFIQKIIYK
jgi:hypothetical protein